MKIAFFHELSFGGARRVVEEYGKRLKVKHRVDLYYVDEKEDQQVSPFFDNVFYFKFLPKKWSGRNWQTRLYKDTIELYQLLRLHKKIAQKIDQKKYDFVFAHPSRFTQTPFILQFLKTKTVYFCQEPLRIVYDENLRIPKSLPFSDRVYECLNRKIRKLIDKKNINSADVILANSRFSWEWIKRAYGRDSDVCYFGVDVKKFRPIKIKKVYDILFLGQKDNIEGYDLLEETLEMFDKKPRVKVIERRENGAGIDDSELVREYNKTKIVVALARNEPFGLIPLEAMACETPVIAVNEGGYRETVGDGVTGFLIKRNPQELANKIIQLMKNPDKISRLGKQGRAHVLKNWTWETQIKTLEREIKKLVKR